MVMAVPETYYHTTHPSDSHKRHIHTWTTTNEGIGYKSVGEGGK